jgi:superfamily II DNA/RNA helicase
MVEINKPKNQHYNFIVLKSNQDEKFKTMLAYLAKTEHKRILIIVNKRQEAYSLNKKLMMESKTSISLYDYLSANEMSSFMAEDIINKIDCDKEEEKVFELIKRVNNS